MKYEVGQLVIGTARGRRRRRKFDIFANTAALAFSRRGFAIRIGSVVVVVAWGQRRTMSWAAIAPGVVV